MEKMPYRPELELHVSPQANIIIRPPAGDVVSTDWREALPVLRGQRVTLRELRTSDAPSLFAMLTTEEVSRFISPPPTTVEGFERCEADVWRHDAGRVPGVPRGGAGGVPDVRQERGNAEVPGL